ncbi:hypothetical protein ABFS82_14G026800 [Erythranthe guttata]|uniref:uncharacterized protein LOC105963056 isoform X1 n=1 Tax=Erythranthe guttata TaxID=4155 RepID=UPI00064DBB00|nr:PREDICTED: uncharacterized protein LOC105963056 isoform X1 [Erythranthe guttata]|eukprot:XP_012842871.1 PREDICTED: uncharacterized protein LOC105963056 isoform X1 [Erythranthe guttata]
MKQSTRLSSAVFQLTPTRTRCDLIIIANGKKEKIASGLLSPFLAHLKTAQDQIAEGGYSILLEPETGSDAPWFTKATLERFVRFVSTPEILERVYTIETEILQIEEAISTQRSNYAGQRLVETPQSKPLRGYEGEKSSPNANVENAIVLYTPGAPPPEANESSSPEGNSKVQLLKVLETRKRVLQKEQGMAFARAVAAGFDIDLVAPLVTFAESFGAMRLMHACSRFMDLWKSKHETGQWLDIEELSPMKPSGVVLSHTPNKHDKSNLELAAENNGDSGSTINSAGSPAPNGQHEYFQGQFPHPVFPTWPMHAPGGAQPIFQAYPVQGMPYYPTYTGNGSFYQPHHYSTEQSPSDFGPHSGKKRQSFDVGNSNNGSGSRDVDRTESLDDMASDAEVSHSRKPRRKSVGSNGKHSGTVVIRNLNYITSKEKKTGSETSSDSHSDIDEASSKSGGIHLKSGDKLNLGNDEVSVLGKDTDDRHWQAFQDCLLRGNDEDAQAENEGVKIKRHKNSASDDTLALRAQDKGEIQDTRMRDIRRISGSMSRGPRGSGDEFLFSGADNDFKGSNDETDIHSSESNGRGILFRSNEEFIVGSQRNHLNFRNSSDPLAVDSFEGAVGKINIDSSNGIAEETLIVPFRSMSLDQVGGTDRTAINIDSEIPSKYQKMESKGSKSKVNYEPHDLSLRPERGTDKRSIGYDLAPDYEMQVRAKVSGEEGKTNASDVKGGSRKSDKDRMSKVTPDSSHKQRSGGAIRKGKLSKLSPLEEARARAESLRSYKANLQKMKKEKEETEMKRIESLKLQRQKRIAARGGSTSGKVSTPSPQTKQLQPKFSNTTNRGSKFSDSEPGLSSPLQRSKIRISPGSTESYKASKVIHMAGNRVTRSSSSISEMKRESNGVTPDTKASMSRIRRLSEPKTITNSPLTTIKARSAESVLKRKLSDGPERNKVSAAVNPDRSKTATLPESKIKTSKLHVNRGEGKSAVKDSQKINATRPSGNAEINISNNKTARQTDADDVSVVEKTVLVLESNKPSLPTSSSSQREPEVRSKQHNYRDKGEKTTVIPESAPIHAPPSTVYRVDKESITSQVQKQSDYNEVTAACSEKDHCTRQSEYSKAPLAKPELLSRAEETAKTQLHGVKAPKMDRNQATSKKTSVKESPKGFRRLLKFGRKNRSSSSVDKNVDGIEKTASTNEVHTLKSLISGAETSTASNTPQKTSRHFSLLSPFRSKTSEKKVAS